MKNVFNRRGKVEIMDAEISSWCIVYAQSSQKSRKKDKNTFSQKHTARTQIHSDLAPTTSLKPAKGSIKGSLMIKPHFNTAGLCDNRVGDLQEKE